MKEIKINVYYNIVSSGEQNDELIIEIPVNVTVEEINKLKYETFKEWLVNSIYDCGFEDCEE